MQSKILIVEDETDILNVLTDILEAENYKVFCAQNGAEALRALDDIPKPDMILLDLLMPIMNGIEFRNSLLNIPRLAKIPILVMTADKASAMQLKGELECIRKPLDIGDLIEAIKKKVRPAS